MDDNVFEIRCRKYLVKRLETLEKDIKKTVSKEKEARKEQIKKMCAYRDTDEVAEAYGYGDITEKEYQEVCDVLEKGAAFVEFTRTPKAAALEILHDFLWRQKREIADFEWSLKSPKEQEEIRKENAKFRVAHGLN